MNSTKSSPSSRPSAANKRSPFAGIAAVAKSFSVTVPLAHPPQRYIVNSGAPSASAAFLEAHARMNGNHPMTEKLPTIAFLFPGQGSQSAGMGKELAATYAVARQVFDEADEALGYKLSELCFEGPDDQLRLTEITQPAILTVSIAAFRVLDVSRHSSGLRRRTQPGRVLGARRRRNLAICRCRAHRAQPRQVHAGGGPGRRRRHGRHSGAAARNHRSCLQGGRAGPRLPARQRQLTRSDRHLRSQAGHRARRRAVQAEGRQARHHAARQRALPLRHDAAGARSPLRRLARADVSRRQELR